MAKTRSGIIGNLKGNIGNVQGAVNNGTGVIRSRNRIMKGSNSLLKENRILDFNIMARVWKVFADRFIRELWYNVFGSVHGYHRFMSLNIPLSNPEDGFPYLEFEPFDGPLTPPVIVSAFFNPPDGITITYTSPSLITIQSKLTDSLVCIIFNGSLSIIFTSIVTGSRFGGTFTVAPEFLDTDQEIYVKLAFAPKLTVNSMSPTASIVVPPAFSDD